MKHKLMPEWLDKLLWKLCRAYRRDRMRAAHTFHLSPIQKEYLVEKLSDERMIRGGVE